MAAKAISRRGFPLIDVETPEPARLAAAVDSLGAYLDSHDLRGVLVHLVHLVHIVATGASGHAMHLPARAVSGHHSPPRAKLPAHRTHVRSVRQRLYRGEERFRPVGRKRPSRAVAELHS